MAFDVKAFAGHENESLFYNEHSGEFGLAPMYEIRDDAEIDSEINRILKARIGHKQAMQDTRMGIINISTALNNMRSAISGTFGSQEAVERVVDLISAGSFYEKVSRISVKSIDTLREELGKIAEMITQAQMRFEKKSITLAVVGNTGMGKSTLIQSITGLGDDVLPSGSTYICTAARSEIANEPDFTATIYFYTRDELLNEVIKPYLKVFGVPSLELITDLDDVRRVMQGVTITGEGAKYTGRFELYMKQWENYQYLLDQGSITTENRDEVCKYVARFNPRNPEQHFFNFLAVKYVKIDCPFPLTHVGHLVLIDTVGVNEATMNIHEQMYQTVRESADFVLYCYKVMSDRAHWMYVKEMELYYEILNNLPSVEAYRWVFFAMNYVKEYDERGKLKENEFLSNVYNVCQSLNQNDAKNLPGAFINVSFNDPEQVRDKLIRPLLSHLAANLGHIDKALVSAINQRIDMVNELFRKLIESFAELNLPRVDEYSVRLKAVQQLTSSFIQNITTMKDASIKKVCTMPAGESWRTAVLKKKDALSDMLPTSEEILLAYRKNPNALTIIEQMYTNTRTRINNMYEGSDDAYKQVGDNAKIECAALFLRAFGIEDRPELFHCKLGHPRALLDIAGYLFNGESAMLQNVFLALFAMNVDNSNLLRQALTQITDVLDPNRGDGNIPSVWNTIGLDQAIIECLRARIPIIRDRLEEQIGIMKSPEEVVAGYIKDFVISLTAGSEVVQVWQLVLISIIDQLRPEAFTAIVGRNQVIDGWNNAIGKVSAYDRLPHITF